MSLPEESKNCSPCTCVELIEWSLRVRMGNKRSEVPAIEIVRDENGLYPDLVSDGFRLPGHILADYITTVSAIQNLGDRICPALVARGSFRMTTENGVATAVDVTVDRVFGRTLAGGYVITATEAGKSVTLSDVLFGCAINAVENDDIEQVECVAQTLGLSGSYRGAVAQVAWFWSRDGGPPKVEDVQALIRQWVRAARHVESTIVEPTRLGGQRVAHLADLPEIENTLSGLIDLRADEATMLLAMGFEVDEIAYVGANSLDRKPWRQAGASLGWSSKKTAAVKRRCDRKIKKIATRIGSVNVTRSGAIRIGHNIYSCGHFERLASGRIIWKPPVMNEN